MTEQEAKNLLPLVRENDKRAIKTLILGYMPYARKVAIEFAKGRSNSVSELMSAAVFAVVKTVNNIANGRMDHDNIHGYMIYNIRYELHKELRRLHVVYIPRRHQMTPIASFNESIYRNRGHDSDSEIIKILDTLDAINTITRTEEERNVVNEKMKGLTDDEVAESLGISRMRVLRIRNQLYHRYLEKTQ